MSDTLTIQVMDALGLTAQANFIIPIAAALSITTASPLPNATQSVLYTSTIAASGGIPAYAWSITAQTGSNTWTIGASSGVLTGTPGFIETDTVTIKVVDSVGVTTSKTFNLTVVSGSSGSITITPNGGLPVPPAAQGVPYELIFNEAGGTGALTWVKLSGPAWGTINAAVSGLSATQALFSGTPPAITGGDTFTLQVTDSLSNTGTITFTV